MEWFDQRSKLHPTMINSFLFLGHRAMEKEAYDGVYVYELEMAWKNNSMEVMEPHRSLPQRARACTRLRAHWLSKKWRYVQTERYTERETEVTEKTHSKEEKEKKREKEKRGKQESGK